MSSVDNRIVILSFDNKDFERNVQTSMGTLDKLKKGLDLSKSAKGLDAISASAKSVNLSPIGSAIESIRDRFSNLGIIGMTVLQNLTNTAMNLGKRLVGAIFTPLTQGGWKRALDIEQATFQMQGLIGEMEGGAQKIKDIMSQVTASVQGTAFGANEAAKVASQLVATGVTDAQQMRMYLDGVAGAAAMTGGAYEEIGHIFTTVAGQGRLMGDQLNQFAYRGLNIAATLSKQMGITEAEFRDLVSKGKISFDQFATGLAEAFGKQAVRANETFTGSLSNMKAALARIGQEFATPALPNLRDIFNSLRGLIDAVHKALQPLIDLINDKLTAASKKAVEFIDGLTEGIKKLLPATEETADATEESAERIAKSAEEIEAAAQKVLAGEYGNGEERRRQLEELGLSYEKVQNRVNELLGCDYRYEVEEEAVATKELAEETDEAAKALEELHEKQKRLNQLTRERALIQLKVSLKNIAGGFWNVLKAGGTAFKNVFSSKEFSDGLLNLTTKFRNFTESIKLNKEQSQGLTTIFEGFFGVIKKGLSFAGKGFGFILDIGTKVNEARDRFLSFIGGLKNLKGTEADLTRSQKFFLSLSDVFRRIGFEFVELKDKIKNAWASFKETEGFKKLSESVGRLWETLKDLGGKVLDKVIEKMNKFTEAGFDFSWLDKVVELLGKGAEKLASFVNWIVDGIPKVQEFFKSLKDGTVDGKFGQFINLLLRAKDAAVEFIQGLFGKDDSTGLETSLIGGFQKLFSGNLSSVGEFFKGVDTSGFVDGLKTFFSNIGEKLTGVDFDKVLGIITKIGLIIGSLVLISNTVKTLKSIKSAFDAIGWFFSRGITGFLDGIKGAIEEKNKILKAGVVVAALAAIVGSIYVISKIPVEDLKRSVITLAAIMGGILLVMQIISKMSLSGESMKSFGLAMAGLGVGLIALSGAMTILSRFSWSEFLSSAGKLGILIGELVLASRLAGSVKAAAAFMGLAVAVNLLVPALLILGHTDWSTIGKGATAIGIIVAELGLAARLAGSVKAAAAFMGLALAVDLIVPAFIILGKLKWETIKQGALALGIIMGEIALACRIASTGLSGAGALLAVTVPLAAAIIGLKVLGEMPSDQLLAGALALGAIMSTIAIAIGVAKNSESSMPSLIAAAGAVAVAAMALYALKDIPWERLVAGGVALSAIMLSAAGAVKIASGVRVGVDELVGVCVVLGAATLALYFLKDTPWENLLSGAASLSMLIISVAGALRLIHGVGAGAIPDAVGLGLSIDIIVGLIGAFVYGVGKIVEKLDPNMLGTLEKGKEVLVSIADTIGSFVGTIVSSVGTSMTSGLGEIGKNLSDFASNAMLFFHVCKTYGPDAAVTIGGFAAGFGALVAENFLDNLQSLFTGTSTLSQFGTELEEFAPHLKKFGEDMAGVNVVNVVKGAKALAALAIASSEIPNETQEGEFSLAKFILGDNRLEDWGPQLGNFGAYLTQFSQNVKNVNVEACTNGAAAITAIANATKDIPNETKDGEFSLAKFILGDNRLEDWGPQLGNFGAYLTQFSRNVKNVNVEDCTNGAAAITAIAKAAKNIPNETKDGEFSLAKFILGDNRLEDWGPQLGNFGAYLNMFSRNVKGVSAVDCAKGAAAMAALANAASLIPNESEGFSFAKLFVGDNSLATWGPNLANFGANLKMFSLNVKGITLAGVAPAINSARLVIQLARDFGDVSTVNIEDFAEGFIQVGNNLQAIGESATNFDASAVSAMVDAINGLVSLSNSITTDAGDGLASFAEMFGGLGENSLAGLTEGFAEAEGEAIESISSTISNIASSISGSDGVSALKDALKDAAKDALDEFTKCFNDNKSKGSDATKKFMNEAQNGIPSGWSSKFKDVAVLAVNNFVSAINSGASSARSAASNVASSATSGLSSSVNSGTWHNLGVQTVQGFVNGINAMAPRAIAAARAIADAVSNTLRSALNIKSPSRVTYEIGEYVTEGFVLAMYDGLEDVSKASERMGNSVIESIQSQVKQIQNAFDINAELTPIITPVVDMTNVVSGANQVGTLFGQNSIGISMNNSAVLNRLALVGSGTIDTTNEDVVNAINGLKDGVGNNVTFNITVDGAESPEDFAGRLVRSLNGYSKTRV